MARRNTAQLASRFASWLASAKIIKQATLKVYQGAPHGITDTHKDQLSADLLAFVKR
jgi:non-heme chloroperoxidase